MTQDEIIEMARQAGYFLYDLTETHLKKTVETDEADEWAQLERFAKLVAQHEREEIAQFIEQTRLGSLPLEIALHYATLLGSYATAIRARGQA